MELVSVTIKKPLFGNYIYVRDSIIEKAIREGAQLEIIVPAGRAIVDPVMWKKKGRIMKKIFKIPNQPMILYGGYVPIHPTGKGKVINTEKEKAQNKLF